MGKCRTIDNDTCTRTSNVQCLSPKSPCGCNYTQNKVVKNILFSNNKKKFIFVFNFCPFDLIFDMNIWCVHFTELSHFCSFVSALYAAKQSNLIEFFPMVR